MISTEWRRWVAENLMLRVEPRVLLATLVRNGIDAQAAAAELREAAGHPYVQAGGRIVQRMKKLESILDVHRELATLPPGGGAVERKEALTRDEFLLGYYAANRPVVLTRIMQRWRALSTWTPGYLKERYGEVEVEVTTGRSSDPHYERNVDAHKSTMPLGAYVDRVLAAGEPNDVYMVANNQNLERPALRPLLDDVEMFPELLDPAKTARSIFLWFGGAGTVTPLHHDPVNVILAQVCGRKRFLLFPPSETSRLYNDVGVFSDVDCEQPDATRYPRYRPAASIEVVLEPGEAIFLPVGWWHHVRALEIGISVSFTNFCFPNQYAWYSPEVTR